MPERFHPGIFQRSGGEIHLVLLDTDGVSVTTLFPGHQQPLHKNYHFGQNVSLLMGFFAKCRGDALQALAGECVRLIESNCVFSR